MPSPMTVQEAPANDSTGWRYPRKASTLPEVYRSISVPHTASVARRMLAFAGPGYLVAVGYMDPGNWATDIAGGSAYGYSLLSVMLGANLMAILLQSLCARLGKTAVEAEDFPGFISNRILLPMINEAIYALMEGVGTPEAIDTVMKLGMNHPMGPLALADLIGLDTCLAILEVLHEGLGDAKYRPCPLLRKYVAAGWLGRKSGRGFYSY